MRSGKVGFDYIVVGAGTAGSIVASRIAALTDATILVVEAGDWPSDPSIDIPEDFGKTFFTDSGVVWKTTPQEHALDREFFAPRGRAVGGSSVSMRSITTGPRKMISMFGNFQIGRGPI